jgi:hypothetical protein
MRITAAYFCGAVGGFFLSEGFHLIPVDTHQGYAAIVISIFALVAGTCLAQRKP